MTSNGEDGLGAEGQFLDYALTMVRSLHGMSLRHDDEMATYLLEMLVLHLADKLSELTRADGAPPSGRA